MEFGEWMGDCWEIVKLDGAQAGLRGDGWGDVAGTDWTVLARLVYLATMRERARCAEMVRLGQLSSGNTAEWYCAAEAIVSDINSGAFPSKPAYFDGHWPSQEN